MTAVILSCFGWWLNLVFRIIGSMRTEVEWSKTWYWGNI